MPAGSPESELQPLTHFPAGSFVRIHKLCECSKARGKLCSMGLTPGSVVEIVANNGGRCRLRVRGADLVLGWGMSHMVFATPASAQDEDNGADPASCSCRAAT